VGASRRWVGLVAIALGVSLVVVDTTIVNVITPSVITDLGIDSSAAQWVQESYAIVFAAVLLLVGRIADLVGARAVFLVGVLGFAATSVLAGLAPSGDVLIAARFLQGVAGAMMLPTSLALLNQGFTGRARGRAFAIWGSTIGAATAVGPVLGGWLAEHASWRWAFGINPPVALVIVVLVLAAVDRSPRTRGSVDALGAVLSIVGLGAIAFGLIEGRTLGWLSTREPIVLEDVRWSGISPVAVALLVGVAALALLAVVQSRRSRLGSPVTPLVDVHLFRVASFRNGNVATVLIGLGEFGVIAVVPLWLQFTLGYTALQSGLALLPLAAGSFVASGASFGLADRIGPLGLVRLGLALEAAAVLGLAAVAAITSAPWWAIAGALLVYGVGVGFATAQVTNVVLADVPPDRAGQAAGVQSAARQLGSALGIALLTTAFYSTVETSVLSSLQDLGADAAARFARTVTDSAGGAIADFARTPQLAEVAHAGREGLTAGVAVAAAVAGAFLLVGLVATAWIPRRSGDAASDDTETGIETVEREHARD
jgi:EmrB/QacA subfamily drug resistance transporter